MGSTNNVSRQSYLFLTLLILLWGLVLCFIGYQYHRERKHVEGTLRSSLQLINLQMGDDLFSGVEPSGFFSRNSERFQELEITVISGGDSVIYNSHGNYDLGAVMDVIRQIRRSGDNNVLIKASERDSRVEYIYAVSHIGRYTICSSCSYSLSFKDMLLDNNIFLIVVIIISLLISLIGYITSQLYYNLDRIQQERDREESDKIRLKRQLTNNINHELKTPICSILGYMEMILNNSELDPQLSRSFVEKSFNQAERLRQLINDLSTITRIEEGGDMIEVDRVNLMELITNLEDDVMPQLIKQNITIRSDISREIIIDGNQSLLYSIFRNLVDNAIAYSGGRTIWITLTREEESHYHFSIRDNGIGIEPKHLPYIFERFYRVDKGRSRRIGGTGLGLSIVKNGVLWHSGTIEAKLSPMGGLEFCFSLGRNIANRK